MSAATPAVLLATMHGECIAVAQDAEIEHVTIARTFMQRCIGLLGRRSLSDDAGLLIAPGGSVHTCWMRFGIDVVFLNEYGEVLRVAAHVPPWRFVFAPRHTKAVLELRAGRAHEVGIKPDELIYFVKTQMT